MSSREKLRDAIFYNDWDKFHRAVINIQNLNYTHGAYTPLGYAALHGSTRMVQELIRRGAFINYADSSGETPVYCAAQGGRTDVVRVLVGLKADPNKANIGGRTPLHTAANNGYMTTVQYLVEECHCEINTKDNDNTTPISDANRRGHANISDYLKHQLVVRQQTAKAKVRVSY